jgi:hypothetical protein
MPLVFDRMPWPGLPLPALVREQTHLLELDDLYAEAGVEEHRWQAIQWGTGNCRSQVQ